jgi:hypothetical protein
MREGILNEPTREAAERLLHTFGEQMAIPFEYLLFVAIAEDGTFRTANYSGEGALTKEAIKLIAKHLDEWAETFED